MPPISEQEELNQRTARVIEAASKMLELGPLAPPQLLERFSLEVEDAVQYQNSARAVLSVPAPLRVALDALRSAYATKATVDFRAIVDSRTTLATPLEFGQDLGTDQWWVPLARPITPKIPAPSAGVAHEEPPKEGTPTDAVDSTASRPHGETSLAVPAGAPVPGVPIGSATNTPGPREPPARSPAETAPPGDGVSMRAMSEEQDRVRKDGARRVPPVPQRVAAPKGDEVQTPGKRKRRETVKVTHAAQERGTDIRPARTVADEPRVKRARTDKGNTGASKSSTPVSEARGPEDPITNAVVGQTPAKTEMLQPADAVTKNGSTTAQPSRQEPGPEGATAHGVIDQPIAGTEKVRPTEKVTKNGSTKAAPVRQDRGPALAPGDTGAAKAANEASIRRHAIEMDAVARIKQMAITPPWNLPANYANSDQYTASIEFLVGVESLTRRGVIWDKDIKQAYETMAALEAEVKRCGETMANLQAQMASMQTQLATTLGQATGAGSAADQESSRARNSPDAAIPINSAHVNAIHNKIQKLNDNRGRKSHHGIGIAIGATQKAVPFAANQLNQSPTIGRGPSSPEQSTDEDEREAMAIRAGFVDGDAASQGAAETEYVLIPRSSYDKILRREQYLYDMLMLLGGVAKASVYRLKEASHK
ncbi:hypothetical protein FA95DRAFT_1611149 [Auriscalpium vulgare]|uniref:Uncharacterized protein n=1 Tax=Auriscalpium vulgare TaxID=40419 RepID=A0ACB8RBN9_9AGAM|nr:hypothetical protein FA95DRAFT_1611149 [Auriscalpium vulgare]